MSLPDPKHFSKRLVTWHRQHGRHDLPWQKNKTPWRIWVSEIMLQQTRVQTVIPYFERFITRFPHLVDLAAADINEVLHLWSGLGYYARARNLHRSAQQIIREYNGIIPTTIAELIALPGIGRSTAGAILTLACAQCHPILDGNVRRVLSRCFLVDGIAGRAETEKKLWILAEQYTPKKNTARYTQAIMDLGASLCSRNKPQCPQCPLQNLCLAARQGVQALYPQRKKTTQLPTKKTCFVILENHRGEILLQQRKLAAVWEGLWCFPEYTNEDSSTGKDIKAWVQYEFGINIDSLSDIPALSPVHHSFSHYHLEISLLRARIRHNANVTVRDMDSGLCWYNSADEAQLIGLPAPIAHLLQRLQSQPASRKKETTKNKRRSKKAV